MWNKDEIKYLPINNVCEVQKISEFVESEIDPYLSIPLKQKMTVSSIDEYVAKLIQLSDGYVAYYYEEVYGIAAAYIRNRVETDRAFLSLFGVSSHARRCGIGINLLKKVISDLPSGCMLYSHIDEKNIVAWNVYQKAGFQSIDIKNGRRTILYTTIDNGIRYL